MRSPAASDTVRSAVQSATVHAYVALKRGEANKPFLPQATSTGCCLHLCTFQLVRFLDRIRTAKPTDRAAEREDEVLVIRVEDEPIDDRALEAYDGINFIHQSPSTSPKS